MGTGKPIDSSAAFLFEVPGSNSPLVVQELQICRTGNPCRWNNAAAPGAVADDSGSGRPDDPMPW
jgi:hypothetical protein